MISCETHIKSDEFKTLNRNIKKQSVVLHIEREIIFSAHLYINLLLAVSETLFDSTASEMSHPNP